MTYKLNNLDVSLLHDGAIKPADKNELMAQIASGDYFALLATQLDQVSQSLKEAHQSDYAILEKSISELLYLHINYKIAKN